MAGLENTSLDISALDTAVLDSLEVQKEVEPKVEGEIEQKTESKVEDIPKEKPTEELNKEDIDKVIGVLDNIEASPNKEQEKKEVLNTDDPPATSVYPALAEFLKEKGIISSLEDASKLDENGFVDVIRKEIDQSKYSGLSEKQLMYMKAMEVGADESEVKKVISVVDSLNAVTDQDIKVNQELRIELIREDLKNIGWEEQRVTKQIERLIKSGEDIEEALHSKANIVTRNKEAIEKDTVTRIAQKQKEAELKEAQLNNLKEQVYSSDKVLSALNPDQNLKDQVYSAMTTAVDQTESGEPINALLADKLKDPVGFEKRLYYTYVLTNGFKDISKLQRKAENKAARRLREAIQSTGVEFSSTGAGLFKPSLGDMPDIVRVSE